MADLSAIEGDGKKTARATILVVEDDSALRQFLCTALSDEFDVTGAVSGEEAVELARELRPDVVLLDVMLPGLSGLDVVRVIRSDERLKDTPVLVMTRLQRDRVRPRGSAGADRFLTKPFDLQELTDAVRDTVVSPAADVQIEPAHPGRIAPSPPLARRSRFRRPGAPGCEDCVGERLARRARGSGVHDSRAHALRPACDDEPGKSLEGRHVCHARAPAGCAAARLRPCVATSIPETGGSSAHSRTRAGATRSDRGARTHRCRQGGAGVASAQARHRRRRVRGRLRRAADRHCRAQCRQSRARRLQSPRAAGASRRFGAR